MEFLRHKLTIALLLTALAFGLTITTNANNLSASEGVVYESLENQLSQLDQALSTASTFKAIGCGLDCFFRVQRRT